MAEPWPFRPQARPFDAEISLYASAEERFARRPAAELTSLAAVATAAATRARDRTAAAASSGRGGAGFEEETPLLQLSLGRLGYLYDVRLHDLYMCVNVGSLSGTCAAARGAAAARAGGGGAVVKSVPLLDAGGGGRPGAVDPEEGRLLQLVLRGAVAGSPAYAAATAQLCLLVELRGLGVTLEPAAVQTVGGLALRLVQRLEQMAAGMEPILPQPPKDGEHTLAFEPSAAPAAATEAGGALRAELGGAEPLPAAAVAEPAPGAAGGQAKLQTGPQTFLFFSPGAAAPAAHGEGFVYEAARSVPPPVVTVCEAARRQALRELKSREARHASVSREAREDRKRQRERARRSRAQI